MWQSVTMDLYRKFLESSIKSSKYKSTFQVPKLQKVSIGVGIKSSDVDDKFLAHMLSSVSSISGQKAILTRVRKSIAGFKTREGMPIGCVVTLRGKNMNLFLDRLINVALPRISDFKGLPIKSFNQSNHYTFGIDSKNIDSFFEYSQQDGTRPFGINVTIVTNAKTREESILLLKALNLPIN